MDNVMELINWCYRAYSAYGQYRERVTAITFTSTTMFNLTYMAGYMRSHFPDVPAQLLHFELRATDGSLTPVNV
jgi:hypothetical protein